MTAEGKSLNASEGKSQAPSDRPREVAKRPQVLPKGSTLLDDLHTKGAISTGVESGSAASLCRWLVRTSFFFDAHADASPPRLNGKSAGCFGGSNPTASADDIGFTGVNSPFPVVCTFLRTNWRARLAIVR